VLLDADADDEARMEAARSLGMRLAPDDVARLRELVTTRGTDPGIRNDALEALARQEEAPPGLADDLLAMWRNEAESPRWRRYCIQHMATVYPVVPDGRALVETLFEVA
jgi:hypothetical protein